MTLTRRSLLRNLLAGAVLGVAQHLPMPKAVVPTTETVLDMWGPGCSTQPWGIGLLGRYHFTAYVQKPGGRTFQFHQWCDDPIAGIQDGDVDGIIGAIDEYSKAHWLPDRPGLFICPGLPPRSGLTPAVCDLVENSTGFTVS